MRRRRKRRMIRLAVILLILAAVLLALVLFRVRTVAVSGNVRHTTEDISAGILTDFLNENTLYLLWKYRDGEIPDTLPYLESLELTMQSPSSILLEVKEKELVGYIDQGTYVYFDASGTVLEITDEIYEGVPVITGASVGEVTLYQKLPTQSSAQLRTILSLLELFDYQELAAEEIRFGEDSDITVFTGGIEAMLGQDEYLEEKVANLKAILETDSMDGVTGGTVHLENFTGREPITFRASETESETEDFAPAGTGDGTGTADGSSTGDAVGATPGSDTGDGTGTADGSGTGDSTGTADGSGMEDSTGAADGSGTGEDTGAADGSSTGDDTGTAEDTGEDPTDESGVDLMVFNSNGELVYNVRVRNGVVVDAYGNQVPGCTVNEAGNVVDAYMNEIDPATGALLNGG